MIRKTLKIEVVYLFLCLMVMPGTLAFTNEPHVPSPTRSGTILYVGGHGPGNYSTIQDAINASVDGDTVFVYQYSSPYKENILIEKSISLIGENLNTSLEPQDFNLTTMLIRHDSVKISSFNFPGSVFEDVKDIDVENASFVNISDCQMEIAYQGIVFNNVSNSTISYNFLDELAPISIILSESNGNSIEHNTIYLYTDYSGIIIRNDSSKNLIFNNYISSWELPMYGILIGSGEGNEIYHNNLFCLVYSNTRSHWHGNYYVFQIVHLFPKIIPNYCSPKLIINIDWRPAIVCRRDAMPINPIVGEGVGS